MSKPKRAIVSVISDLTSDQRVHRTCMLLHRIGYQVTLVGRKRRNSIPLDERLYKTTRMRLLFEKKFLFYAEYNLRLFFFLLFKKCDLLVANDLDTLLANYLISKIKKAKLVYDSHEYFTEVPELANRKLVKNIWERIEKFIFPKLKYVVTVSEPIAQAYKDKYGVDVKVVRNIPNTTYDFPNSVEIKQKKAELNLPEDKKIILLQGAQNVDRGLEEAIMAMSPEYGIENAILLLIGDGDITHKLKKMVANLGLEHRVKFLGRLPFKQLIQYTVLADIGLTFAKDTNLNYRFGLPNKFFDYIHAGVPVLASNFAEVAKIVRHYDIGEILENHEPQHIAEKINFMLSEEKQKHWRNNIKIAAKELNWEKEEKVLLKLIVDN